MHVIVVLLIVVVTLISLLYLPNCTKEDPHTTSSLQERIGNGIWIYLNVVAGQFPDHPTTVQKQDMIDLISMIIAHYPCTVCRIHALHYLKVHPIECNTKLSLIHWIIQFHNVVNHRLGKSEYTYEEFREKWTDTQCKGCEQL